MACQCGVPRGQASVARPVLPGERRTTVRRPYSKSVWNGKRCGRQSRLTLNPIESAFSISATVTRRVHGWRDGDMRERWCLAGLLDAETRFRRIRGHGQMKDLIESLQRDVEPGCLDSEMEED